MMSWVCPASLAIALIASPAADAEPGATAASPDPAAVPAGDAVVARGKGFEIRRSSMDQVLATAIARSPQVALPQDADVGVLNQLIEIQLVLQKATDAEKAEGWKNAGQRIADVSKAVGSVEFARRLKATRMTEDDLRLMLYQEDTAQRSLTRQLGVNVTDADVKKYFDDHPGVFDQPERARVRELLLSTTAGNSSAPLPAPAIVAKHQRILDLYKRVRAGEDFAALAKQYNEDPISKAAGGEFSFPRTQMEFGDLAFSMKPNQISDVLTNSDGYRLFQLLEIVPAKKIEFAAIAGQIKKALQGGAKRRLAPAYISQLRKDADVQILDPGLEAKIAAAAAGLQADGQIPQGANLQISTPR
jgi:parvulin-like peptidyl-prolyl isomerase